jgi:hypothetical protein
LNFALCEPLCQPLLYWLTLDTVLLYAQTSLDHNPINLCLP